MKYVFYENHKPILSQLCDLALKTGGLSNLGPVNEILRVLDRPTIDDANVLPEAPTQ